MYPLSLPMFLFIKGHHNLRCHSYELTVLTGGEVKPVLLNAFQIKYTVPESWFSSHEKNLFLIFLKFGLPYEFSKLCIAQIG
jgi:hypothetical protein